MTDSLAVPVVFECSDPYQREAGMTAAVTALKRGDLVLLPTDTVYGVAADAFTPSAVTKLLAAKNRGRSMPVPVLIGEASTLSGLVVNLPPVAHELAEAFWPGGWLGIEHADQQGSALPALVRASGSWSDVADHIDLAGRPRYTTARLDGASDRQ